MSKEETFYSAKLQREIKVSSPKRWNQRLRKYAAKEEQRQQREAKNQGGG